ncbi:hypothetical protein DFH09DRAFT_1102023 [Mycena vulgaris]|nr:hypothetical protein DFH09DRAFT_1102023 [Mycena vulgaris]
MHGLLTCGHDILVGEAMGAGCGMGLRGTMGMRSENGMCSAAFRGLRRGSMSAAECNKERIGIEFGFGCGGTRVRGFGIESGGFSVRLPIRLGLRGDSSGRFELESGAPVWFAREPGIKLRILQPCASFVMDELVCVWVKIFVRRTALTRIRVFRYAVLFNTLNLRRLALYGLVNFLNGQSGFWLWVSSGSNRFSEFSNFLNLDTDLESGSGPVQVQRRF